MSWPPILIDEDFHARVARALRSRSSSPIEITVEGDRRGAVDSAQVDRAAALGGVLLSHNHRERRRFRAYVEAWRRRGNQTISALLLRQDPNLDRLLVRAMLLLDWYTAHPLPKPETLIWNDAAQAVFGGYRPPGHDEVAIRWALGHGPAPL